MAGAALTYTGLVGVLTWQALRGQSVVSPDSLTLAALAALAVVAVVLTALALGNPGRRSARASAAPT